MRKILLIVSVLSISLSSCGQCCKEYTFQEIGLHIKIPKGYFIQDTFPKPTIVDSNGNRVTEPAKLKDLEADLMKALLLVSSPDRNNTVSFNIAMETSKTGNFEQYYTFSKNMQLLMTRQRATDYDTLSSTVHVDSTKLYKFLTYSIRTKPVQYSGIYLASVKNYFLIIKADYIDEKFGEDIEKAILTSKFD